MESSTLTAVAETGAPPPARRASRPRQAAAKPNVDESWMPSFGAVVGGKHAGSRYHFLRFVVVGVELAVEAIVTPPHWPFPKTLLLLAGDYDELVSITGERAKNLRAEPLIEAAIRDARLIQATVADQAARGHGGVLAGVAHLQAAT